MNDQGFFDTIEMQRVSHDPVLNGILDSIFETVSDTMDYFQDIPENAILAFKKQIIQRLQPEIDRVRREALVDLKKEVIAQLPSMKLLIEQKGPELIDALQKQIALEVVRSSVPWVNVGAPTIITPGDRGLEVEKDLILQIPNLISNKEIAINDLKFGNPKDISQELLTPDVVDSIQQNISIPLRQNIKTHLAAPIRKQIAYSSLGSFGLGIAVTIAGYTMYGVLKKKKERQRK